MARVYNFSAGPAALPEAVLNIARDDMLDWHNCGMGVMEMSHRGKEFSSIAEQAVTDLRHILAIPNEYKILFLQGGATSQFAMVPINLLHGKTTADYVNTGVWSKKAIKEAKRFCDVNVVATSEANNFTSIPAQSEWNTSPQAAYLHYTPNETIGGVEFPWIPETAVPLVADMSSTILSRPIDVSRFGLIYAGAQKNIGPAGITVVIVREDLLGNTLMPIPSLFDYAVLSDGDSMVNTPPTYSWYIAGLVFAWIKNNGGLSAMAERNQDKAKLLYDAIDASGFYQNPVEPEFRSWMNVPFTLPDTHSNAVNLNTAFLDAAKAAGLVNLKGHRSVGGMRASIYNAMPKEGVVALIDFMADFEKKMG